MLRSLLAAFLHLRKRNFIFNSKSRGFFAFECFITIGVVFKLTVVPVALVFEEARFTGYGALNAFVDVMLLLDILVRFRTSFEERMVKRARAEGRSLRAGGRCLRIWSAPVRDSANGRRERVPRVSHARR